MSIQNVLHEVDLIRPLKIRSNSSDVHMPFSLGPRIESLVEPNGVVVRLCFRSVFRRLGAEYSCTAAGTPKKLRRVALSLIIP